MNFPKNVFFVYFFRNYFHVRNGGINTFDPKSNIFGSPRRGPSPSKAPTTVFCRVGAEIGIKSNTRLSKRENGNISRWERGDGTRS